MTDPAGYSDEEVEVIRRAGLAEMDWSFPGGWLPLDPGREPIAFVTAEGLVARGVLERGDRHRFRLTAGARIMLAAALAPEGKAGLVLGRSRHGRGRVRRKGSR